MSGRENKRKKNVDGEMRFSFRITRRQGSPNEVGRAGEKKKDVIT